MYNIDYKPNLDCCIAYLFHHLVDNTMIYLNFMSNNVSKHSSDSANNGHLRGYSYVHVHKQIMVYNNSVNVIGTCILVINISPNIEFIVIVIYIDIRDIECLMLSSLLSSNCLIVYFASI